MKTLAVKLREPLAAKLTAAAKKRRTRKTMKGSVLELTKDLAGSVWGGPDDLSYNKAHMRNFGR